MPAMGTASTKWNEKTLHLCSFALSSIGPVVSQLVWSPDVVITLRLLFLCTWCTFTRKSVRWRTITWLHIQDYELDAAFELGFLKGSLRYMAEVWERQILKSFSRVSSISNAMVNRLKNKGVKESRSYLLPNWVDLEVIKPQSDSDRMKHVSTKIAHYIRKDSPYVFRFNEQKQGLDLLVKAIHQLSDLPNLVWLLAGEGPTKEKLVAATTGLSQVHHLPVQPIENLYEWLNAADIHLLPQKSEATDLVLPSKLMGIVASGRPVVATSKPGSELARIADKTGFCVEPNDTAAFCTCIRKLVTDSELRLHLGKCARNIAEQHFEKDVILSRLRERTNKTNHMKLFLMK